MSRYQSCVLCGVEGPQVHVVLVEWKDPEPHRFDAVPRCSAVEECRARVDAQGEPWPLVESRNVA